MKALLVLEDGRTFDCSSFTGPGEVTGELVFNTSMTGYQEILTDPSYRGQMITMTYPLVGNYGINPEDVESEKIQVAAFIVKEYQEFHSNFRASAALGDYLKEQGIMGIEDLDTRALTRHIRNAGAMRAVISTDDPDKDSLIRKANNAAPMAGLDLVKDVTTGRPYSWIAGKPHYVDTPTHGLTPDIWQSTDGRPRIAALDFGIKFNIIRCLVSEGFEVVVLPATTGADMIKALQPDGIFLSNGPGDPEPVTYAAQTVAGLMEFRPIFGICLGHQILSLALGCNTYKLKFGHRGANQPVKNLLTGRVEITSQNHGFAVDMDSIDRNEIEITHMNLNDNTLEGFRHRRLPLLAVQYHPEASPGPHDARYLFGEFKKMIDKKLN
ncbi:MAG: glutamine-hydrolyzing carbamoyl-phosphate synthase small subunit [Desulfobacteraceae bacterium]|nr:glutamine-hydrolyzing carbamoyl-phosphate synthase small subunit [Desulfobacteraceae bacterium]